MSIIRNSSDESLEKSQLRREHPSFAHRCFGGQVANNFKRDSKLFSSFVPGALKPLRLPCADLPTPADAGASRRREAVLPCRK